MSSTARSPGLRRNATRWHPESRGGSRTDMSRCIALDWQRTPDGMDYVRCDGTEAVECEIVGIMLTVNADLCDAHRAAFRKSAIVRVMDRKSEAYKRDIQKHGVYSWHYDQSWRQQNRGGE